jgi:hypothetical protein
MKNTPKQYMTRNDGLYAVIASIPLLAMFQQEHPYTDDFVPTALRWLAQVHLADTPEQAADQLFDPAVAIPAVLANTLWNVGKVVQEKPGRCNNFPLLVHAGFSQCLPQAQGSIGKDYTQVNAAARWLAAQLDITL